MTTYSNDSKRILYGFIRVSFFILVVKLFGVFKEIAVANRFGVSEVVDSYTLSLAIVSWIPAIWIAVINSVYVPLSQKLPLNARQSFNGNLFGLVVLAGLASTLAMFFLIRLLYPTLFDGLTESGLKLLIDMSSGLAPIIIFGLISAHLSVLLLAKERHINTLTQTVPSIALIIFLYFWPSNNSDAKLFIVAMLLGTFLQILALFFFCKRANFTLTPKFDDIKETTQLIRNAVGLMLAAQLIASFSSPIALYYATTLGEGSVSVFGYATKFIALIVGLGATAIGRAVLPVLSSSSQSIAIKKKLAYHWSLILFLLGTLSAIAVWLLAEVTVEIVFERGAFTSQNTQEVAEVVKFGAMQLPFVFSSVVFGQYFASRGDYRILFYSGCISLTVVIASSHILIQLYLLPGLMLATVASLIAVNFLFLFRMYGFKCNG